MDPRQVDEVLNRLSTEDAETAWSAFLEAHARVILQVIHLYERDADRSADCFAFVCEHLCGNGFRRLRRFRRDGPASFTTWLRAVVRNLCLDWLRSQHGRSRGRGWLRGWSLLPSRIPVLVEGFALDDAPAHVRELPDPALDPEAQAAAIEARDALRHALRSLAESDRLLIRLRFEEELTLEQVARLTGLKGPQGASRRIEEVLGRLREAIQGD